MQRYDNIDDVAIERARSQYVYGTETRFTAGAK
jgi:hypothetical protein